MGMVVGMGQMLVEGGKPEANLARAARMIEEAGRRGCEAAVLPECMDVGWTHPSARELAQPLPGPFSDRLAQVAKQAGIYVVAGLVERAGDKLYNAAVLLSPDGGLLLKHRKINELDIAHDLYSIGDRLSVAETPFGIIGVNICADNFPSSLALGESLARMGAKLLLSPCAWAVDGNHDNETDPYGGLWKEAYSTLATRFGMAVVGVSNVGWMTGGPWGGRKCIGCSLAMGPKGEILAEGPYGDEAETLLEVNIPE
jgi:predicted amidohydrolase